MNNHSLTDSELCHWKYLRRERVNGKWRYYYEKDDKRLNVDKVTRKRSFELSSKVVTPDGKTHDLGGSSYYLTSTKTGGVEKEVDKKTWDSVKVGRNYYVGDTLLKDVRKENIEMGKQFVKDFLSGNVYIGKKKKQGGAR